MKTVMKKMFSLLLVAALLVSAVPVAFADETVCEHDRGNAFDCRDTTCTKCGEPLPAKVAHDRTIANCTTKATCKVCGSQTGDVDPNNHDWAPANCTTPKTCKLCGITEGGVVHDRAAANCTTPAKCTICGSETGSKLGHIEVIDDAVAATCTTDGKTEGKHCSRCNEVLVAQETIPAPGHQLGSDKVCAVCHECDHCKEKISAATDHLDSCPNSPKYKSVCDKCGEEYVTVEGHDADDCKVCLVCWEKGDTGVRSHTTAAHCPKCNKTDGTHKTDCDNYVGSGSSKVKIHVNLYTSNTYTATKELVVYTDSSSDTIYYSVAEHTALIEKELEKQYPKYKWYGNVYEAIKGDDGVEMSESIGNGVTVYINAYSAEAMVLIAVHNTRTMAPLNDSYIQLHGKMLGETVTKNEVLKAVSKNYNVNSMRMYSEQDWEDYVAGKTINSVESLKITTNANHEPFYIDVYISGSAKTGSSSSGYTADSSNPKTGDTIFAPIAVMGLSVSALAVLLYLNKKRAF